MRLARGNRWACVRTVAWTVLLSLCAAIYLTQKTPDAPMTVENATLPVSWVASDELLSIHAHRRHHMHQACRHLGLDRASVGYNVRSHEFLVNQDWRLVWCNVFKAASSTWLWNFNQLAGYTQEDLLREPSHPLPLAHRKYPRLKLGELQAVLSTTPRPLSFMISRHPLIRIVSVYRDKILPQKSTYLQKTRTMKRLYPKLADPIRGFQALGTFILGQFGPPSFRQFVQYVIDRHARGLPMDEHWVPASQFCTPCLVNYTILAKVETLEEDSNYIIFTSGIQNQISPRIVNRSPDGMTTEQVADHYLCQLSRDQLTALLRIYHHDLILFEYDVQRYLDCTAQNDGSV